MEEGAGAGAQAGPKWRRGAVSEGGLLVRLRCVRVVLRDAQ